jgi:hypothetical protein
MRNRRRDSRRKLEREGARRAEHRERQRQARQKRASIFAPPQPDATAQEPPQKLFVTAGSWLKADQKL